MVTGSFDSNSVRRNHELAAKCFDLGAVTTAFQACHILSESTMQHVDAAWSSGIIDV